MKKKLYISFQLLCVGLANECTAVEMSASTECTACPLLGVSSSVSTSMKVASFARHLRYIAWLCSNDACNARTMGSKVAAAVRMSRFSISALASRNRSHLSCFFRRRKRSCAGVLACFRVVGEDVPRSVAAVELSSAHVSSPKRSLAAALGCSGMNVCVAMVERGAATMVDPCENAWGETHSMVDSLSAPPLALTVDPAIGVDDSTMACVLGEVGANSGDVDTDTCLALLLGDLDGDLVVSSRWHSSIAFNSARIFSFCS